jgi:7-cyano-7-deazaguanine synthase
MSRPVAVVSGGLDSVTALYLYVKEVAPGSVPLVLTFDYGQPARVREKNAARFFARRLSLEHRVIKLPWMASIVPTAMSGCKSTDAAVWVPNRNGVFISVAAAISESMGGGDVILGFNRDEGASFPDNTPEFIAAMNSALRFSTGGKVRVVSPTVNMSKAEMASRALALGIDTSHFWSCYGDARLHCGVCPSCVRLFSALEAAGVPQNARPGRL